MNWEPLLAAAIEVRRRSHSPYSRFAVGAAVLTEEGAIFSGANVENRSFGVTLCAERSAFAAETFLDRDAAVFGAGLP